MRLTLVQVPAQVPKAVEGVEREGCCENSLAGVLDSVRETSDKLNDVCGVKRRGCNEVGEGEAVKDCRSLA